MNQGDIADEVRDDVVAKKGALGAASKAGAQAKVESKGMIGMLRKESQMASQWFKGKGALLRATAIAGGAWLAVALLANEARSISSAFHTGSNYSPPGYVRDVYGMIDSGSSYSTPPDPMAMNDRIKERLRNTTGLVQRIHDQRSGHHRYGNSKSDYQMENLYGVQTGLY